MLKHQERVSLELLQLLFCLFLIHLLCPAKLGCQSKKHVISNKFGGTQKIASITGVGINQPQYYFFMIFMKVDRLFSHNNIILNINIPTCSINERHYLWATLKKGWQTVIYLKKRYYTSNIYPSQRNIWITSLLYSFYRCRP